jgi:zinc protease
MYILGGDPFTSRIGKRLRVKEGLSYSAGSYASVDTHDDQAFYSQYASFSPENLNPVKQAFNEEVSQLLTQGITAQELKDAQSYLLHTLEQQRNNDAYLTSHLQYQTEMGIDFSIHIQHRERIEAANIETVNAALKKYLSTVQLNTIEIVAGDFKDKP